MTNIHLRKVTLKNGETLGYREREGGEQVIILIHGNMTSSKHWDVLLEQFDPSYKLFALDLRGFGISTYHQPIDSHRDFAQDVKYLVDELGLSYFSLAGWSTGGGVAMQFAADYPEDVHKLILLESLSSRGYPFFQLDEQGQPVKQFETKEELAQDTWRTIPITTAYKNRDKEYLMALWNALIYTHNQPSLEQYDEYIEDMITQRNLVDIYYANNRFNISHVHNGLVEGTKEIDQIQAPTLILWGENDLVVTEQMAQELKEDFGERAQLIILKGCGHSPLIDDLPQLMGQMTAFLED